MRFTLLCRQWGFRFRQSWGYGIPRRSIYLSAAQHAFEHARFFRWLDRRPDVLPVFVIHDFIPLDYPEFFPPDYKDRFRRRVDTIVDRARAIVTTTQDVARRVEVEYRDRGRPSVPIHVEPLASSLELSRAPTRDHAHSGPPYFIAVSTIEPRKNHRLLINVWRAMARRGGAVPKLVLVGQRGWMCEQITRELDFAPDLQPHIIEISGVPSKHLQGLIQNARALLMPSFAEGYGLPVVEALTLGTPVVCSDLPVFHEVSQNAAKFLSPLDGKGWLQAVEGLSDSAGSLQKELSAKAAAFVAPSWRRYFEGIERFLGGL